MLTSNKGGQENGKGKIQIPGGQYIPETLMNAVIELEGKHITG